MGRQARFGVWRFLIELFETAVLIPPLLLYCAFTTSGGMDPGQPRACRSSILARDSGGTLRGYAKGPPGSGPFAGHAKSLTISSDQTFELDVVSSDQSY